MYGTSQAISLRQREISPQFKSSESRSIGFSSQNVAAFTKIHSSITHKGCINTVKFNADGSRLITGSDDRQIKIWDSSGSFHSIPNLHTIRKF